MSSSRPAFVCASCTRALRQSTTPSASSARYFSSTPATAALPSKDEPRWKQTPPAMRMPFRLRPETKQPAWSTNTRQEPVDEAFDKFIGTAAGKGVQGRDVLDEEIKWQSLTHKSFDHARRPFNDKLAFLGRRILDLQTSLLLLAQPSAPSLETTTNRNLFAHPSLTGLENITPFAKNSTLDKRRLAQLAGAYGLGGVVRWRPRKSDRLESSGRDVVLAQAVCAVLGAVALQRGGDVAARVARERVLGPLGLK